MAFSSVTIQLSKNGDAGQSQWRQDLTLSNIITCSLSSTVGVSTYRWRIIGRPEGSGAGGGGPEPIALGNSASASFTVDQLGTYIVECLLNGGAPDATILTGGCAILESIHDPDGRALRLLGPFETDEDNSDPTVDQGQDKMLNRWLRTLAALDIGGGTLAAAYNLGMSAADQTLTLTDAHGGPLVIDASGAGLAGDVVVQMAGYGGLDAFELVKDGSLAMGLFGVIIGEPGFRASAPASGCVAIGRSASVVPGGNDPRSIAVGMGALAVGQGCVVVGESAQALVNNIVSIGSGAVGTVYADSSVVVGANALSNGQHNVVVGDGASSPVLIVSDVVVVGHGASASAATIYTGGRAVAVGSYSSSADGGVSVGYSAQSGSVDAVLVGRNTSGEGVSDVVVGAGAQSTDSLATGGAVLVGGGAQGDSGSVVLGEGAQGVDDSVVAGLSALAASSGSVVLGRGAAATPGSNYSVVAGVGATSKGSQSVVVGYSAESGTGVHNVVVGPLSILGGVGANNTLVGSFAYLGDPVGETRDFNNNVRVGSGNGMYSNYSVAVGGNTVVGDTSDASIVGYCVAVGEWATVVGSYGMAFGLNASADSREVVFGDNVFNEGYVAKFHAVGDVTVSVSGTFSSAADSVFSPGVTTTLTAVGSLPVGLLARQAINISGSTHYDGNWFVSHVDRVANKFDISTVFAGNDSGSWANDGYGDLFSFDEAQLTGVNTTVMTLVIKQSGGAVVNVPVTLSAPVGGISILQVANS